jgi:[CysO sulfur-carrier protein]-S-L-cysteine hydrolase
MVLRHPLGQGVNFAAMQQELPGPLGVKRPKADRVDVRRDVHPQKEHLASFDAAIAVLQLHLGIAKAFDLCANELNSRLVRVEYLIVVTDLFVVGENLALIGETRGLSPFHRSFLRHGPNLPRLRPPASTHTTGPGVVPSPAVLHLSTAAYGAIIAHVYDGVPMEACGLIAGTGADRADMFFATDNDAKSARVYTIPPRQHLRAELSAEDAGMAITGVVHSHTHTDAYPSPTDVAMAPDPSWHYVIVSLRDDAPVMRSFRILDGNIHEEPVALMGNR